MTLNVAMLGTGRIADNELAPALAEVEGVQLWSVLSRDANRAAEFARTHGAKSPAPVHTDLESLLADPDLHAVVVATPDRLHAEQVIAAARAGKHVLCEKPMATESDDGRAMVDACNDAGVVLAVAYHMRWHMGHRRMAQAVHRGMLGELRHMRVQWTYRAADASNWRASPEVGRWWGLAGVGTHCLDQIRWFMGPSCGEVTELKSLIARDVWHTEHDETAVLALRFESGATAELCTSVLYEAPRRQEVYGREGYAIFHDTLGPHGAGRIYTKDGDFDYEPGNPYVGEIRDFEEAVRLGRLPEVGGEEALRNVELLIEAVS